MGSLGNGKKAVEYELNEDDIDHLGTRKITNDNSDQFQKNEMSICSKLSFALAAMPYQMFFSAISVFSTVFLLEVSKLPPEKTSIILFVSRAIDAITDPIYGYFINKTKPTRFGKNKPWIFFSLPFSIITYLMVWYVPDNFSDDQTFWWFLIWNCLFFTVLTGIRIPYISMTRYLSSSKRERDTVTIIRMGFEMIGILAALGIQSPFVSTKGTCKKLVSVDDLDLTTAAIMTSTQSGLKNDTFWQKNKYVIFAAILSAIFFVTCALLLAFVKENIGLDDSDSANKPSILKELKKMFTFKPFLILLFSTFFNTFGIQVIQNNLQLYFEFGYTAINRLFVYAILGILVFSVLVVPFWKFLMTKVGKKLSMIIGCSSILPLLIGLIFFKNDNIGEIVTFFALALLGSNCFAATFLIPWAMLPDCIDEYYLKYRTKPDALFYTFFVIGPKILMAVYLGISQAILGAVGYENGVCSEYQKPGNFLMNILIMTTKINLYSIIILSTVPFVSILSCIIIISFYPITEEKARLNTEKIKKLNEGQQIETIQNFNNGYRYSNDELDMIDPTNRDVQF